MLKPFTVGFGLLLLYGCVSYGGIDNDELMADSTTAQPYSIRALYGREGSGDIGLTHAFFVGGTRAAALAQGVLEELCDITVVIDGQPHRLLDQIDNISSVSGGSFTSAYYGLYGEQIFADLKDAFLRRNVEEQLIQRLFNPLLWFGIKGRNEMAVQLQEKERFHGAIFADLQRKGGPLIFINTSGLYYGVRFSFIQEYFDLLCSDLSTFPVAQAVAVSSAVPLLFSGTFVVQCRGERGLRLHDSRDT